MEVQAWTVREPKQAMVLDVRQECAGPGEVIVKVAGCGVCHTDLGFFYDGVPVRHPFPLTLGHEISGRVVEAAPDTADWMGREVVVPAVIPCGQCPACNAERGGICPKQIFPGNDVHGGFASHVRVPARGLCPVPDLGDPERNPGAIELSTLSVIADAVSTPYQAILRSQLGPGDLAIFVGVGGVGGFGVQIAAALGAHVVGLDTDAKRLGALADFGLSLGCDVSQLDFRSMKARVKALAKQHGIPSYRWKIFETSGTAAGQTTAFGLVGHGAYLSVVGFTPAKIEIRLSNLMAFDATAEGNWGCLPQHYPAIVDLVLAQKVALAPFVEHRPLSTINTTFEDVHAHRVSRRVVLVPEH